MNELASFLDKTKTAHAWKKVGVRPHHGICLPLSSLHSQKSPAIGSFSDLLPLIDWCKSVGLDCIQLLPITDSGDDPSPYNAVSSCALNPIYLDVEGLPFSPRLLYQETRKQKMKRLFSRYETLFPALQSQAQYLSFVKRCRDWLDPYALFMAIKDENHGKQWMEWPQDHEADPRIADFYRFLQYECECQMQNVKEHASKQGILLKGDIPILVSPDSADVWSNQHLFDLKQRAGAPPDYYSPLGQRWGFPNFNQAEMRKERFAWWKSRVEAASRFFHIYRIDHFVGLFRIWCFPEKPRDSKGAYFPANPDLWEAHGREILDNILPASDMLPIAEDLGVIPKIVHKTMYSYGLPGMAVIRWQRRWDKDSAYIPYKDYDPLSVTTISTHDSPPLTLWWQEESEEAASFAAFKGWAYTPPLSRQHLKEILYDSHHTPSLFHINLLQEYLALFPELISHNPKDERINVPGTSLSTNWTYRFKPSVEVIVSHEGLRAAIRELLS